MSKDDKRQKLNTGHFHEAIDRAHIFNCIWEDHICNAPAVARTDVLREQAREIADKLGAFYLSCGEAMVEFDEHHSGFCEYMASISEGNE